jgi:hypothetical protein
MTKIIGRIFSDKYVNHKAVVGNVVLLLMYRFAYPFAVLLNKLNLSPNQITTQSLLFSILAFAALVFDEGWILFSIFWGMTVLLDFCDGTVARMTDKVSKSAFRYDHMSDLFKISLVLMGVGLRYNDQLIWMLAFSASFGFMYGDILNPTLGRIEKYVAQTQQLSSNNEASVRSNVRMRDRYSIIAWVAKYDVLFKICINTFSALLAINGHTLLLFLLFPFGFEFALSGLGYLLFIELLTISLRMTTLIVLRR